jgi:hypothetical protein
MDSKAVVLNNALADRAETVRELIAGACAAHMDSINKALEAGQHLVEAREECKHGEWLPFLERAGIHERQARRLMQVARSGLKSDTVSDLGGIKGALDFLSKREKAAKALNASLAGGAVIHSQLRDAIDLIDEVARCFPIEKKPHSLQVFQDGDLSRALALLDEKNIVPKAADLDIEVVDGILRRMTEPPLPDIGRALVIFHRGDVSDYNQLSFVLPSERNAGYHYAVTLQNDSAVFTPRPLNGTSMSLEGKHFNWVWGWLAKHIDAHESDWLVEECDPHIAIVAFEALRLDDYAADAHADMRMGDVSGITHLIELVDKYSVDISAAA